MLRPPSDTILSLVSHLRLGEEGDPHLARRLDEAFGRHEAAVRAFCRRELAGLPAQEAEDAVQDVLLVAWRRMPEFRGESSFRTWLCGIASRTCANHRRKRRDALAEDGLFEGEDGGVGALALLRREERDELVRAASAAVLEPRDQEIVYLRYTLDAGIEEIAGELGITAPDEVRVALQRSRRRLESEIRRRLEALGHGSSFVRPGGD